MKQTRQAVWLMAILAAALAAGCAERAERDVLFQTATLGALVEGVYDGNLAVGELKKHGDLGLGTFDALDGEMVMLDGRVYRIGADGKAEEVADEETTPFATVTFFEADHTGSLEGPFDLAHLEEMLDKVLPTKNIPYAVRIEGTFARLKTRSVPRQTPPYLPLTAAVANQTVFTYAGANGTIVGFTMPQFFAGLNVPGYHLHFISDDKKTGGHILDMTVPADASAELDITPGFHMILPESGQFAGTDLTKNMQADLAKVER